MVKTKSRLRLCVVLLCCNLAFIWGNSLMTADMSRAFSTFVKDILAWLLPATGSDESGEGHHLLRKLAHFTEFTCLGVLLSWLIRMLRSKQWEKLLLPLAMGALAACVDETIQVFVPGRGPGILDVGIDTLGVTVGILLILIYESIKQKFWRKIQ